ncbi:MAG: TetR/AcrR family transcriptional regulator [Mycobacterium sp.]
MPKTTQTATPRERTPPWAPGARSDRTRDQILKGACLAFQDLGFASTRVDQIAQRAAVSRPTFYVYFASKLEAFLAVAERSVQELATVVDALDAMAPHPSDSELAAWVEKLFAYFDDFGAFATVWRQAAFADDSLQEPGWQAQQRWGRRMGLSMDRLRGKSLGDPVTQGLATEAMLESLWFSSSVNVDHGSRISGIVTATAMLRALLD